jgi:DNA repair exonuclease SbcCD ATPase subunit
MYCQEEVEAQFAEWLESQRGAPTSSAVVDGSSAVGSGSIESAGGLPFPRAVIVAHLAECRDALSRAREKRSELARGDALGEALARASSRLEELAADFDSAARPDAEKLENSLTDLEALIDRALRGSLPADAIEEKRAEAEEQLRPYRARMERATYEQTLDNLLAKALRESAGVPRLSLFYL